MTAEPSPTKIAQVTCLASVQPKNVEWLFPGRIAIGKLTMIGGDPGLGKSLVTLNMASIVSTGGKWPDGSLSPVGDVLMFSAEDSIDDTIRPRLDACGGNPERVFCVGSVVDMGSGASRKAARGFSLEKDVDLLANCLQDMPEAKLVVIDPISAYLGSTDSHNNSDVRGVLSPIANLAECYSVAVVAINHLNKGQSKAMYRLSGSIAFMAAARAGYVVTKDIDDPDRRLFLPVKNNLGTDSNGFAYRVKESAGGAPFVEWESGLVCADDVDAALEQPSSEERSALKEATAFLIDLLSPGVVPAKTVYKKGREAGHSDATIRRAKDKLGVRSEKEPGASGRWVWRFSQPAIADEHLARVDHDPDQEPEELTSLPSEGQ